MIGLILTKPRYRARLVTSAMLAAAAHLWSQAAVVPGESSSVPQSPQAMGVAPKAEVTILEDTLIRLRTIEALNSKTEETGASVAFMVSEDVVVDGSLAIPRGAIMGGTVVRVKKNGVLTGAAQLTLRLDSLQPGGRTYPVYSYQLRVTGTSKTGPTARKVSIGAAAGAVVAAGAPLQRTPDTTGTTRAVNIAAGATAGAGVGTVVAAATPGPGILIPADAEVEFELAAPITVTRVSGEEAARLGEELRSGGPSLYVRGETP
jgi:hypothetical protein